MNRIRKVGLAIIFASGICMYADVAPAAHNHTFPNPILAIVAMALWTVGAILFMTGRLK